MWLGNYDSQMSLLGALVCRPPQSWGKDLTGRLPVCLDKSQCCRPLTGESCHLLLFCLPISEWKSLKYLKVLTLHSPNIINREQKLFHTLILSVVKRTQGTWSASVCICDTTDCKSFWGSQIKSVLNNWAHGTATQVLLSNQGSRDDPCQHMFPSEAPMLAEGKPSKVALGGTSWLWWVEGSWKWKALWTKATWGERALFGLYFQVIAHQWRKSRQELKQEHEVEAIEEYCLLVHPKLTHSWIYHTVQIHL